MKCFRYSSRPKSYITVKLMDDPYGDSAGTVVSVGCTLKGDMQNPTWKVHIPLDLAASVGQELVRLASGGLSRDVQVKTPKTAVKLLPHVDKSDCQETPVQAEPEAPLPSGRAEVEGRVIRRAKKEET